MAIVKNKMVPVIGIVALAIVAVIIVLKLRGGGTSAPAATAAAAGHTQTGLPPTKGADRDSPAETLKTVVAKQSSLSDQVQQVLAENKQLRQELQNQRAGQPLNLPGNAPGAPSPATPGAATQPPSPVSSTAGRPGITDAFGQALDNASHVIGAVTAGKSAGTRAPGQPSAPAARVQGYGASAPAQPGGMGMDGGASGDSSAQAERVLPPMGYAVVPSGGKGQPITVSYVPTPVDAGVMGGTGAVAQAAAQAASAAGKAGPIPYFTLPENATLVGVMSMTSLIGRIPVEGRVTDPYPFKAVIGHDNLAANGFDLPGDIAGMIVTGVAVGDMTLSCSEGRIYSATFIFNDGSVRTVSTRHGGAAQTGQGGAGEDLGYVSDMHGNPCIQGKFVTNAPAFIADMAAMGTLTAVGQAYATAQQTISQSAATGATSAVTGNMGTYALGQGIANSANEISKWLLAREKNSFDAVVTPSGQQLVVHLDKEIDIDKDPHGRRLVHRSQAPIINAGERYGLE